MCRVGRTEHVHNVQQNGAGVHTHRVQKTKKQQKNHFITCRRMHERETVMQSGENPAVLVVCVCVKQCVTHTYALYLREQNSSLHFTGQLQCECSHQLN